MARIAFAWELGGEYGHVMSCAGLARGLETHGHHISFMFRELRQLQVIPEAKNYDIFQAPRSIREGVDVNPRPAGFPDILLGCGYGSAMELTGLLGGWRSLLARWKPDMVVADFAPTAMLAARTLGIPCVTYGNGFFIPPKISPLPAFRIDDPVDPVHLALADAKALEHVNIALQHFGAPPLSKLADLLDVTEDFLCTFPELDHYERASSGYYGPRVRFDRGADIEWPADGGKRVFVYVKKEMAQLEALLGIIAGSPHRIVTYIPDLDEARKARLIGRGHVYSPKPLRLDTFLRNCDMLVTHGGEIATGCLAHGIPALMFPTHFEQYITARRMQQLGSGFWCAPHASSADVDRGWNEVLNNPIYQTSARNFANRYKAFSPAEQRRRIIARIEELLSKGGAILSPTTTSPG